VVQVRDAATGQTTTFREPAPYITTEELGRLAADYRALLDGATAVVLCGSLPAGLPAETYGSLTSYADEAGVPVVLGASGSALLHGAERGPALIVPDQADEAAGLQTEAGTAVVMVTDRGVLARTPGGPWLAELGADAASQAGRSPSPESELDGFRDGLVAGFVPGIALGWSWPDMLRHALALAVSASPDGEVDLAGYEALLPEVTVTGPGLG